MHAVETGHGDNCSGMVERAVLQPYPARQNRRRGGGLWENSAQSSARWGSRGVMKRERCRSGMQKCSWSNRGARSLGCARKHAGRWTTRNVSAQCERSQILNGVRASGRARGGRRGKGLGRCCAHVAPAPESTIKASLAGRGRACVQALQQKHRRQAL